MAATTVPAATRSAVTTRPFDITFLVVIGYLSAAMGVIAGLLLISARNDAEIVLRTGVSANALAWLGVAIGAAGLVKAVLAFMLAEGSQIVRVLFGIVAAISLATGIWGLIALHATQRMASITQAVFAILVLYLLFNPRSSEFFDER